MATLPFRPFSGVSRFLTGATFSSPAIKLFGGPGHRRLCAANEQSLYPVASDRVTAARDSSSPGRLSKRDTITLDILLTAIRELRAAELAAAKSPGDRNAAHAEAVGAARYSKRWSRSLSKLANEPARATKLGQPKQPAH